ncbi:MAG: class I SAM-dependent methyltransferase [Candidatus Odinarchaeota archaeon]
MDLKKILLSQVRKPSGKLGKIIAKGMNRGHSKLAKWGISNVIIKPNYLILDIGCGGGGNIKSFAKILKNGKVYGIDYSKTAVYISTKINKKYIEKGIVKIQRGTVSSLPFNDNYFDLISGFEAYYFWPDLVNDLKEIYRVLKPKGSLILVNEGYICKNQKKKKKAEKWAKIGNFSIHSPEEYRDFLKKAGFSNIQIFEENKKGWITAISTKKV